ncbi:hypothetical protein HDV01_002121 [Terramyces sp. JEL0728]|nr:hypothetical protein HDV01_002121 [Terramyces sp. JEL0728]
MGEFGAAIGTFANSKSSLEFLLFTIANAAPTSKTTAPHDTPIISGKLRVVPAEDEVSAEPGFELLKFGFTLLLPPQLKEVPLLLLLLSESTCDGPNPKGESVEDEESAEAVPVDALFPFPELEVVDPPEVLPFDPPFPVDPFEVVEPFEPFEFEDPFEPFEFEDPFEPLVPELPLEDPLPLVLPDPVFPFEVPPLFPVDGVPEPPFDVGGFEPVFPAVGGVFGTTGPGAVFGLDGGGFGCVFGGDGLRLIE